MTYVAYGGGWPAGRSAFYVPTQGADGSDAYRFFDKLQREIGTQSRLPHGAWQSRYQLCNATGQVATDTARSMYANYPAILKELGL